MRKAVFITGTDTDIGKTVISAGILNAVREKGINCAFMKPVQCSGDDFQILKEISKIEEPDSLLNPYCFKDPLSPHLASKLVNIEIREEKIIERFKRLKDKYSFIVVEGAGGLLVPLRDNYLIADLISDLEIEVILVSSLRVGTINHTLLSLRFAKDYRIKILGVIFNQCHEDTPEKAVKDNPEIISKLEEVNVLGIIPFIKELKEKGNKGLINKEILKKIKERLQIDFILEEEKPPIEYLKELEEKDKKYIWHPFTQMKDYKEEKPLIIEEGKGCHLKDIEGNWYLDGISSLWVNLHGHRRKEIDRALITQIYKISHSTLLGFGNIPSIKLAEKLVKITPEKLTKVFYSDNGSTSVEISLKMAFQYWQHKGLKEKRNFLTFHNAYHGDTIGAVSVGGIKLFHEIFSPLLFKSYKVSSPYCYRCHLNLKYPECNLRCIEELKEILKERHGEIAALIIEPIVQAASGIIVHPEGFLRKVRELTKEYNVLMIADEVATGFGRTGKMFACNWEEVSPDILCLSKSITAGYLPLGATLVNEEIFEAFLGDYKEKKSFFHGHSYTGNQLSCVAALENLKIFEEEKVLENLKEKIEFLKAELERFLRLRSVGDIRQKGFMVGIELVKDKDKKAPYLWEEKIGIKVAKKAIEKGVILRPLGNVVVIMPPLSISIKELERLISVVYSSIKEVT